MNPQNRQAQKRAALQQSWQTVFDTLTALRNSRNLETRVEEKLRMDALIQQKEAELATLETQLDALESATPTANKAAPFSGQTKLVFTQRLGDDWRNLADLLEIPLTEQRRFSTGDEARAIWEWLELREQLHVLPSTLREIRRDDLARVLANDAL